MYPATRDPSNPLLLPTAPGPDPLHGTHFFVDGPRHGVAAIGIELLLGFHPGAYSDTDSWTQLKLDLKSGPLAAALRAHPTLRRQVSLLYKIANQPETQKISLFSMGGRPGAIYAQTQKILCTHLKADPGAVPVLTTLFAEPHGKYCAGVNAIRRWRGVFVRYVDEMAAAIDRHPAVILSEIGGVGVAKCLSRTALGLWEANLAYEMKRFTMLPHTVVYLEAGYSDAQGPRWTADVLNGSGVWMGRGFFTDDTHFAWTSHEMHWADQVSSILGQLTHQTYVAHYIINTAQNGRGPELNPHPHRQGIENLCNPAGRGIGRPTSTNTAPTHDGYTFPLLDAFLWTGVPGLSHGSGCHPGDAPAGHFDQRFALELSANANQQLGPGYPSRPY
jgi:hypothetical protein